MKRFPDENNIHLWRINLDVTESRIKSLAAVLSEQESARARRYLSFPQGHRFIAARGMLRLVLGGYLGIMPKEVRIAGNLHEKPYLETPGNINRLSFNLSHSNGTALIGIAVNRRIGVDLEYIDEGKNHQKLAARFFGTKEADAVAAAPEKERAAIFFRYWTAKEAYLKALGDGIRRLKDIGIEPDGHGGCRIIDNNAPVDTTWTVLDLSACDGYTAAAAMEGEIKKEQIGFFTEESL